MAFEQEEFNIEVGTDIIGTFQRIDIEYFRIFSEFIDNSFQSFLDHKQVLQDQLHVLACVVKIEWTNDRVVITDNSFGMNREGFSRALRLNAPAKNYSEGSLSKYGMGLKYAACNLGSIYTIETSEYGSNIKYKATIDVDEWKRNSPKTMLADKENDFDINRHFTSITVKNLYHKYNSKRLNDTINKLANMYSRFIDKKLLNISINNINVKYDDPELDEDENGSSIMDNIESSFIHEGVTYKYWGWIGVLKTGDTAGAGFTIIQNNRGIIFNYRPKEVFGRSNGFPYQRIIGQIELDKDSWNVRINKDGINWSANGLEDAFVDNLSKNPIVKKLVKYSKEKRVHDKRTLEVDSKNCVVSGTNKSYTVGERIAFSVKPFDGFEIEYVKVNSILIQPQNAEKTQYSYDVTNSDPFKIGIKISCKEIKKIEKPSPEDGSVVVDIPPSPPTNEPDNNVNTRVKIIENVFSDLQNISIPGESINETPNLRPNGVVIKYANTAFSFEIEDNEDVNVDSFFDLRVSTPEFDNSYTLTINYTCGYFKGMFIGTDLKDAITIIAIALSLARITGVSSGLKLDSSKILVDKFNKIISKTKRK